MPPEMQPVVSTNIASVGHDESSGELWIEFHSGGTYRYFRVPREIFNGLLMAGSVGGFFHSNVRDSFPFERVR